MAFDSGGLSKAPGLIGGTHRIWEYRTTDSIATVTGTGYFALMGNGLSGAFGMKIGDRVRVNKTDTYDWYDGYVSAVDASYNATMSMEFNAEVGSVTLSSNAGTVSKMAGKITTESLTTAAGASQALTITNTMCASGDVVLVHQIGGTNSAGTPIFKTVAGSGSFVITADNKHASAAFNGTFILGYLLIKA